MQSTAAPGDRRPLLKAADAFKLDQNWTMFRRSPPYSISFRLHGAMADGAPIRLDLIEGDARWRSAMQHFRSLRFKVCLEGMLDRGDGSRKARIDRYLYWLCQQWNTGRPPVRRVRQIDLYVFCRWTLAPKSRPPDRLRVGGLSCGMSN